ncbi:MAG: hypothetical protein QOG04_6 [Actinomycetota bacterium]|jgi:uncharacterized repeat protein (TIGR03943 family)|nr:hypothetical protein [Actinomycetota bacterium]
MYTKRGVMAVILLAWGAFLAWLAISNTMARFLGPRTYWVAWFGAIALLLSGTITTFHALRSHGPRAGRADWAGVVLLLLPIALVLSLPAAQLGAQAASRKAVGVAALSAFAPPTTHGDDIGLEEIHYAGISHEYAAQVGIIEGAEVDLTGFVTHPKNMTNGTYSLTRFYISCCAADAVPYSVAIEASEDLEDDTWLNITGTLVKSGDGFIVQPVDIQSIKEPSSPYLY